MSHTTASRRAVIDAYLAGATARELGARHGVDQMTVQRWLRQADVARRRVGPRGRTDVTTALVVELRDVEQLSFAAIAAEVDMSKTGVLNRYRVATEGARRGR